MLLEKTKIYGVDGVGKSTPTLTLDANGSQTPVEFEANVLPGTGDFPYSDTWSDEDLIPWAE